MRRRFLSDVSVSYGSNTSLRFLRVKYCDSQGDILIAWMCVNINVATIWPVVLTNTVPLLYCLEYSLPTCREFSGLLESMATAEGFLHSPLVVWVRRSFLLIRCVRVHCLQTLLMKYRSLWAINSFRAIESLSLCFFFYYFVSLL